MARTPYSDPEAEAEYQKIVEGSSGVSGFRPETANGTQSSIPMIDVTSVPKKKN